jgi:hypothetical protein
VFKLPKPILAEKWRRITFLYTTGEYLRKAVTINDLLVQSDERRMLWQALRERANQYQDYHINGLSDMQVDPTLLAAFLGIKELEESKYDG